MDKVIRNIFLLLFLFVLTFNFLYIIFGYMGTGAFGLDSGNVFVPTRENFMGFEHWFSKLESYPGLKNIIFVINDLNRVLSTSDNGFTTIINILARCLVIPFEIFIAIMVDIVNNVIWFFNLLDPYHNFTGF